MDKEVKKEYARLLREGRTEEATELVSDSSSEEEDKPEEEEVMSEEDRFAELKGVGDELAVELVEEFGGFEAFKDASVEDLEPVPGIGEKRAESLLEQVE